eukprot:scaffold1276_cov162-Amphora_coffeaeformis.AAC.9
MTESSSLENLPFGPTWVLSHDKQSISRSFHAQDWTAAVEFLNQLSAAVTEARPDFHLTNGREIKVVLKTTPTTHGQDVVVNLAQTIDQIPVAYAPEWFRQQQRIDASDDAVKFDETHYQNGLNGFFLEADAIAKFGTGEDGKGPGIFENAELRDIAAAKDELVRALRLEKGNVVADIGAGTGLLVPLLSEAVGDTGKVILSELSPLFREHLAERYQQFSNIVIVDNPTERDPKLPTENGLVDLALMVDVYHHLEYPQAVLRNIRASLQRHGALVVVDFHRDPARIQSHDEDWVYKPKYQRATTKEKDL